MQRKRRNDMYKYIDDIIEIENIKVKKDKICEKITSISRFN